MPQQPPPFQREKYSLWNWSARKIGGGLGELFSDAASFIPLPEAIASGVLGPLKAALTSAGVLFPEQPYFSQIEGLPSEFGAITDVFEELTKKGVAGGEQALGEALFELGILDRGNRGGHAAWVPPMWLVDP